MVYISISIIICQENTTKRTRKLIHQNKHLKYVPLFIAYKDVGVKSPTIVP